MTQSFHDHVIVCGVGKVGYRIVQKFLEIGQEVVAIESDERRSFNELVRGQGVPLLIGDARQMEPLVEASLKTCLALVIVTNDDLTNLDIALTARELRPDIHIVMRVFNDTLARKVSAFGIRTTFSTSAIAAPTFAAAALMRGVQQALHVGKRMLSTIELTIHDQGRLSGIRLNELEQRYNISAIELRTSGYNDLRPQGSHQLAPGDTIVVVGELHVLSELRECNCDQDDDPLVDRRRAVLHRLAEQSGTAPVARHKTVWQKLVGPVRRFWRLLRANLRDADLLLRDSFNPLGVFLTLLMLGTWALALGYYQPTTGVRISWTEAFYAMLMMAAFQPTLDLPHEWPIQLIFFTWPFISLYLLGRGALSFVLLLFDKRHRRDAWDAALASTYSGHVIVCGLSKSGFRVVQEFIDLCHEVVAIDRDPQGEFNELVRAQGVPLIIGDSRQEELLRNAGVEHCLALVITSDDDLVNLDTALTAREINPRLHIVLSIFNDALARKLEGAFGIRTAFSSTILAAPTFAAAALMRGVRHALHVSGRLLSTIELTISADSRLDGRFLGRIEQEHNVSVIELRTTRFRAGDLRPRPDHRLSANDLIVIVGELQDLDELRKLNQEINDDPMGRKRAAVLNRLQQSTSRTDGLQSD